MAQIDMRVSLSFNLYASGVKVSSGLGGTGVLALPWWGRIWYVRLAAVLGIRYFDTAQYYGPSEQILGRAGLSFATIVTKWGMGAASSDFERWSQVFPATSCIKAIRRSKQALGATKNFGFLLHLPVEKLVQKHIEALKIAKEKEGLGYIGYSADARHHILSDNSWCDWVVIHHSLSREFKTFPGIVAVHGAFGGQLSDRQLDGVIENLSAASEIVFLIGTSNLWRLIRCLQTVKRLANR